MNKVKVATIWLDGCSGCHMSFLDMDERLLELAERIELVYSPLVDRKDFPDQVDVALIEGAVANDGDLEKIRKVRQHTKILVSLGDCAVTSNVPSMRNSFSTDSVMKRAYQENATAQPQLPATDIPKLLPHTRPVHEFVKVDVFIPGCPPSADLIFQTVKNLLDGITPTLPWPVRFG